MSEHLNAVALKALQHYQQYTHAPFLQENSFPLLAP
jgi:hypothetical protein